MALGVLLRLKLKASGCGAVGVQLLLASGRVRLEQKGAS